MYCDFFGRRIGKNIQPAAIIHIRIQSITAFPLVLTDFHQPVAFNRGIICFSPRKPKPAAFLNNSLPRNSSREDIFDPAIHNSGVMCNPFGDNSQSVIAGKNDILYFSADNLVFGKHIVRNNNRKHQCKNDKLYSAEHNSILIISCKILKCIR